LKTNKFFNFLLFFGGFGVEGSRRRGEAEKKKGKVGSKTGNTRPEERRDTSNKKKTGGKKRNGKLRRFQKEILLSDIFEERSREEGRRGKKSSGVGKGRVKAVNQKRPSPSKAHESSTKVGKENIQTSNKGKKRGDRLGKSYPKEKEESFLKNLEKQKHTMIEGGKKGGPGQ